MPSREEAEEKARTLVNKWAAGAAAVGWIPGSSLALGVADLGMVAAVAESFGVQSYSSEAVIAAVAAGAGGRTASELLSFVPVFGWAVKAGVAASVTKATGEAVIRYFRVRSPYD